MQKILFFILMYGISIPQSNSQVKQKSFKMDDKSRIKYSIYLPQKHKKADSLTLVIALHWGWGKEKLPDNFSEKFMDSFALPVFENNKTIIIAPNCPEKSWIENKSVSTVLALRKYCIEKYNIDTSSIVITGFSLGGIGTWYLATHYSNLFNYAIPVAGYPEKGWLDQTGQIRILAVNSIDDEIIPFEKINTAVEYLKSKNTDISMKKLHGIGHYTIDFFIKPVRTIFLNNKL